MSEPIPAEITIGGDVPAALVPELCELIAQYGVSLGDYDNGCFEPKTAEDLLEGAKECDGVLFLCDAAANYGVFSDLENFCFRNNIAFRRKSDAKYEYDGEIVEFRPGWESLHSYNATQQGDILIGEGRVREAVEALDEAEECQRNGCIDGILNCIAEARDLLRIGLPPDSPIPALKIVIVEA